MKTSTWVLAALCLVAPLAAQASCDSVKADISQKIINNGVPESGFTLDVVPNDQAERAGGQVVGHCENDTQKIVYKRSDNSEAETSAPSEAGTTQDTGTQ
ncbi:hypothetical protein ED28_00955 [[Pantoea] beijingensis]|uniref:DUF1161 domain-containing protein n=1 Tax=[Pantoea] beijingensis TaxID=1324864 RepID=A0A443IHF8_9GAMM|nr:MULTISPECIES: DUF1161 domain-containing protein [Erwiniaceae]RWR03585.1 hypothetical protein ED28_00955 [[Pantoea] beijingensis]